jgi:hypothetical protein
MMVLQLGLAMMAPPPAATQEEPSTAASTNGKTWVVCTDAGVLVHPSDNRSKGSCIVLVAAFF